MDIKVKPGPELYFIMEERNGDIVLHHVISFGRQAAYAYLYRMNAEQPARAMMVYSIEKYLPWLYSGFGEGVYG